MFVRVFVVPAAAGAEPLPLAVNLRTDDDTEWEQPAPVDQLTETTYPLGVSEGVRDLGKGEFASRINLQIYSGHESYESSM